MLDARDAVPLPGWLRRLASSGLAPLAGIATALREDHHAVAQGITTPHNSGVKRGTDHRCEAPEAHCDVVDVERQTRQRAVGRAWLHAKRVDGDVVP